jgi:hypothetical protein
MSKLLEKIAWKTRKFQLKCDLFILYINSDDTWGFSALNIRYRYIDYSLLSIKINLPNKTYVNRLKLYHWDVLFLRNHLWKTYDNLSDSKLWGSKLSIINGIKLNILKKIF